MIGGRRDPPPEHRVVPLQPPTKSCWPCVVALVCVLAAVFVLLVMPALARLAAQ